MSRINRLAVAAVLAFGVMFAGGVVGANPQPALRGVCTKVGQVVSTPVRLVCKQTVNNGLRWRKTPITTTTTPIAPSTTVAVVPTVSLAATFLDSGTFPKAAVATSNVAGTVYFIEGASPVNTVSDITSARNYRWTSGVVAANTPTSIALDVDVLTNGYYRVFVANSQGVLSEPAFNKVTISISRASDVVALTCATGGSCEVGETGPGGGKVFYYSATAFTSTGSTCNTNCHYLEAAPSDHSSWIVWATTAASCYNSGSTSSANDCQANSIYSGSSAEQAASRIAAKAIGKGMGNTNQIYSRLTAAGSATTNTYAAGIAWAYTNNSKTDWFLPSMDELHQLYLNRVAVGGLVNDYYWSSSEEAGDKEAGNRAWTQYFNDGNQYNDTKPNTYNVRLVRAF
jgi:hypothetical protein